MVKRWTRVSAWLTSRKATAVLAATAFAGMWAGASFPPTFLATVGVVMAGLVVRGLAERELQRLPSYQADAHARGDPDALAEVRRIWTNLGAKGPRADALAKTLEGEELALREKWKEARDAFLAVDLEQLPSAYALNVKDWIAYVTAQAGDPLRALEIVDAAIAAADVAERSHLEHTRARVLVLLGRPADALPFL